MILENKIVLLAGLVCVLVIIAGGFYWYKTAGNQGAVIVLSANGGSLAAIDDASTTVPLSESTPVTTESTAGMRLYQNAAFHFGLLFPDNLVATEYKEQGGALTVSFQDSSTSEGFEVFVTPYDKTQIDQARFTLDEPSGTFLQPQNVVVGGTPATMFYGRNGIMGDTREVWFIRGGYLYEVATYKALDTWLGGIIQTWKFI